jgi:hypothetical protein
MAMGILDWFRGAKGGAAAANDTLTREACERIVQLANPRLRFAHRYRQRLAPALRTAMDYARSVVAGVPPALDASPAAWQSNPAMRAFFATGEDVLRTFSQLPELRAWFEANPAQLEVYTVLSMMLVEKHGLGAALEGDVVRRDVPQTTISFSDHRARMFGASEMQLREEIERRIVDQLSLSAVVNATDDHSRREVLEQERALLRMRLRLLQRQGAGVSGLGLRVNPELGEAARIQMDLAMNEANLNSLSVGRESLDYQLERLCDVLSNPEQHFSVSTRQLRIDRMNVVVSEGSTLPAETLDLRIARIPMPDGPPEFRVFMFVHFPRIALLPKSVLQSEAARLLR